MLYEIFYCVTFVITRELMPCPRLRTYIVTSVEENCTNVYGTLTTANGKVEFGIWECVVFVKAIEFNCLSTWKALKMNVLQKLDTFLCEDFSGDYWADTEL